VQTIILIPEYALRVTLVHD